MTIGEYVNNKLIAEDISDIRKYLKRKGIIMLYVIDDPTEREKYHDIFISNIEHLFEEKIGAFQFGFLGGQKAVGRFFANERICFGTKKLVSNEDFSRGKGNPRHWNAFGEYRKNRKQPFNIIVEINIPIGEPNSKIAGLLVKDTSTDKIYLAHSGKIGGGKPGIGRKAFLEWNYGKIEKVIHGNRNIDLAIIIGDIQSNSLALDIEKFVFNCLDFKNHIDSTKRR